METETVNKCYWSKYNLLLFSINTYDRLICTVKTNESMLQVLEFLLKVVLMIKESMGNNELLNLPKTAFLCSRQVPAGAVLKCYDWAIAQREGAREDDRRGR